LIFKAFGFALVLTAFAAPAWAKMSNPEIDPGLATSAMTLLGGGLMMISSRRRHHS